MVSAGAIGGIILNILISVILPVLLVIVFYRRYNISLKAVLIGVLVFVISQVVLRIPLVNYLGRIGWFEKMPGQPLLPSLLLALSAGLFEETGRYIGFRYFLYDKLRWKNGLALGLGHGGIEAILLVGISNIQLLVFSFLINHGTFENGIGARLPQGSVESIKEFLINGSFFSIALGGIERLFAYIIHTGFALLVLYAVMKKRKIIILYAVLLHGVVDIPAAYVQMANLPLWTAEVLFFVIALTTLILIIRSKKYFKVT